MNVTSAWSRTDAAVKQRHLRNPEIARKVSARATPHARRKRGVFALA